VVEGRKDRGREMARRDSLPPSLLFIHSFIQPASQSVTDHPFYPMPCHAMHACLPTYIHIIYVCVDAYPSLVHQALIESQFTSTPTASIVCLIMCDENGRVRPTDECAGPVDFCVFHHV
jgi:hypothetical protein